MTCKLSAMQAPNNQAKPTSRRERFAWCMYDFANSGYTTVILTAVFNSYFVAIVANSGDEQSGAATLLWTITLAIANGLVLLSAPIIGAIADHSASKKSFLMLSTIGCICFTALLTLVGPGDVALGMILLILATFMFATGESLIAAFLPEIAPPDYMGRLSGYGWTLGYLGGLLTLGLCIVYIEWAMAQGMEAEQYIPTTNLIVATIFAIAALPSFLWLKERAVANKEKPLGGYINIGFTRLRHTLSHATEHRDLFRFLIALTVFHAGINTIIVLAAIYAQEAMGFDTSDTLKLILVVNISAALGAFALGHLQDRIGSKRSLILSLISWIIAIGIAYKATDLTTFWLAANLIGLSLGASQSASRALVGQFSPPQRSGEFFGLWGMAVKLSAIIGPLSYGATTYYFGGDHRLAILSTLLFFCVGLLLLLGVDEQRGRLAAQQDHWG